MFPKTWVLWLWIVKGGRCLEKHLHEHTFRSHACPDKFVRLPQNALHKTLLSHLYWEMACSSRNARDEVGTNHSYDKKKF